MKILLTAIFSLASIGALVGTLTLYSAFSWGIVSVFAFDWFIHPMFPHLSKPTLAQLVALSSFVCIIGPKPPIKDDTEDSGVNWQRLTNVAVYPWAVLFAAWVVHLIFAPGIYTP